MFAISTIEAIMTNLLINNNVEIVTSFEDYFGEEILICKMK